MKASESESGFIDYIWEELYYDAELEPIDSDLCYELANQFYIDFCTSNNVHFGHNDFLWNQDLGTIIAREELELMETAT